MKTVIPTIIIIIIPFILFSSINAHKIYATTVFDDIHFITKKNFFRFPSYSISAPFESSAESDPLVPQLRSLILQKA
jgi:hypothetical protein